MSDKVEMVARALCKRSLMSAGLELAEAGAASPEALTAATLRGIDRHWNDFVPEARAAIEAMHEPTEDMLMDGQTKIFINEFDDGSCEWASRRELKDAWNTMIDAALK